MDYKKTASFCDAVFLRVRMFVRGSGHEERVVDRMRGFGAIVVVNAGDEPDVVTADNGIA